MFEPKPLAPLPLRCRILGALELAPMTVLQLATSLDVTQNRVRRMMVELREAGVAHITGTVQGLNGHPRNVWSLAA